ncbi:Endoplasmic reticulum vesicle transporter protein [Zea mays]|uniref:Endoplasmic reticulum vesicle transporter protein n=1 Tax=Zea mays TaxID=4577 RepID=A0A1D6E9B5_MAIZE|nr:Endoplasmic reticulum vesicle transporter protein [Zea mays]
MDGLLSKLRSLDAYPKVNEDFYSRTLSGGIITLVSSAVMLLLFVSELRLYLHAVTETTLRVDTSRGETLRINFDVTFPALQCSIISLDAMDISGQEHLDVKHDVFKQRIDAHGNVIATRQDVVGGMKVISSLVVLKVTPIACRMYNNTASKFFETVQIWTIMPLPFVRGVTLVS